MMGSDHFVSYFAKSYAQARNHFEQAAQKLGCEITSYRNPARGKDGEPLTTDTCYLGPETPQKCVIVCSGTHGVEGYFGSGCQVTWLQELGKQPLPTGLGILFIHAINPHGFSWSRRVTEDNVDLNRNFINHQAGIYPENHGYEQLAPYAVPSHWEGPQKDQTDQYLLAFAKEHGESQLTQALAGGQYHFPQGLFYGGNRPTWSNQTLLSIASTLPPSVEEVVFIDLHSGFGEYGMAQLFYDPIQEQIERCQIIFDPARDGLDISLPQSSGAYVTPGDTNSALTHHLSNKVVTPVCIECGTVSIPELLNTLRVEASWHIYGNRHSDFAPQIQQAMTRAFYPDDPEWKLDIWKAIQYVIHAAVEAPKFA